MPIIAFITDAPTVRDILVHLGEPTASPRIAPARGPPLWDLPDARTSDCDPHAQPAPAATLTIPASRRSGQVKTCYVASAGNTQEWIFQSISSDDGTRVGNFNSPIREMASEH